MFQQIYRHDEQTSAGARLHADEILGNNRGNVEVISEVLNTDVEMKALFARPADEHHSNIRSSSEASTVIRDGWHIDTCELRGNLKSTMDLLLPEIK